MGESKLELDWTFSVAAPRQVVFATLTDPAAMPNWMPGFAGLEILTDGPTRLGSRFRESRKMMGHTATEEFEVTAFEPPHTFELYVDGTKGSSKSGWYRFRYTLTQAGGATEVRVHGEIGGMKGCMGVFGKLMLGPMKKAIRKDHDALKAYIERG